jgi:hypothetical protein
MAKNQKNPVKEEKPKKEEQKPAPKEEEKPFDFGGIPDRNLKKNLGCS